MNTKPTLNYKIVKGFNPQTNGTIERPVIVDCEKFNLDDVIEYGRREGYFRGQHFDLKGASEGLFEALQHLVKMGKQVELGNCFASR